MLTTHASGVPGQEGHGEEDGGEEREHDLRARGLELGDGVHVCVAGGGVCQGVVEGHEREAVRVAGHGHEGHQVGPPRALAEEAVGAAAAAGRTARIRIGVGHRGGVGLSVSPPPAFCRRRLRRPA